MILAGLVDGLMVSVGSTNFDHRSFRLNDEANLNVHDAEFASRASSRVRLLRPCRVHERWDR
jgi:cardiolipin synthase